MLRPDRFVTPSVFAALLSLLLAPSAHASGPGSEVLLILLIPGGLAVAGLVLFILLLLPPRPGATGKGVAIAGCIVGGLGLVSALLLRNLAWAAIVSGVVGAAVLIAAAIRLSRKNPQAPR